MTVKSKNKTLVKLLLILFLIAGFLIVVFFFREGNQKEIAQKIITFFDENKKGFEELVKYSDLINTKEKGKIIVVTLMKNENKIFYSEDMGKTYKYGRYKPIKVNIPSESFTFLLKDIDITSVEIHDTYYVFYLPKFSSPSNSYFIIYKKQSFSLKNEGILIENYNNGTGKKWLYEINSNYFVLSGDIE